MAAINMPTRQEQRDPLDIVVKGLGIAQSIYGIKADITKADAYKAEAGQKEADRQAARDKLAADKLAADNKAMGIFNQGEVPTLLKDFNISEKSAPGSQPIQIQGADGVTKPAFIIPRPKEPRQRDPLTEELARTRLEESKRKTDEAKQGSPDQRKLKTFVDRLNQSEQIFANLENGGFDRSSVSAGIQSIGNLPNALKSKEVQQQAQAERNFVNSILRRESGAAISESEFANAEQQYFTRQGDSPETKEQKRQNRQLVIDSLRNEAGPAGKLPAPAIENRSGNGQTNAPPSGGVRPLDQLKELAGKSQADQLAAIRNAKIKKQGIRGSLPQKDSK